MQSQNEKTTPLESSATDTASAEKIESAKGGARPKIRNPKEAKRRRFVMKQAKTISKPQPLESVSESEESQTLLPKQNDPIETKDTSTQKKTQEFFGVRSYVHTFYEAMAMDNPHGYEDIESHFGYIIPVRKRRKEILCWRLMMASGVFILVMGIIALSVGFLVPKKKEVVDTQEDIQIIDKADQAFNKDLDICKMVGLVLFCTGGLMVSAVFLALMWMWKRRGEDPLSSAEEMPLTAPGPCQDKGPSSLVDAKVPATEEVTAVQPKRMDPEEVVMTNAGLCKIP